MSARPPLRSNYRQTRRSPLSSRLWIAVVCLAAPIALAAAPTLSFPTSDPLVVASSPQLELGAFALALSSSQPIDGRSPAHAEAFANATRLSQSSSLQALRDLQAKGLSRDALYRYLLLHSPPPELEPTHLKLMPEPLAPQEVTLLRDSRSDLKRMSDGLRRLFRQANLQPLLTKYAKTLEETVQAYDNAFPGDYPATHLFDLSGDAEKGGPVVLVPSLLAQSPGRFELPLDSGTARVSVLPVDPDGAPDPSVAAMTRYEEVGGWVLEPLFNRFRRELGEVGGSASTGSGQLLRALYLYDQERARPDQALAARKLSPTDRYPLVPAFEDGLKQWDSRRQKYRDLAEYMPELLDRASLVSEGKATLPSLIDPGFEHWSGAVPEAWNIEVIEPATGSPRPSNISRAKGEARGGSALMLSGDATTNEWQGVMSQPLPVLAGDKVTLTGRMRSVNVTPQGRRVTAAHLEARVVNREGTILRRVIGKELTGSNPWETVKIEFSVPASADRMQVGCMLAMVGELYFDNITLEIQRPIVRRFLQNGSFEEQFGNTPEDWEVTVASRLAQSGPSIASRWELDHDGPHEGRAALKLTGDAQTSQWLEVRSQVLGVSPGQRVTVGAWMRSRGVQLDLRQHRHANLTLTFLNERGLELQTVESPVLEGSSGWKPVELEVVAPMEATAVRVGTLLTMTGELWVDEIHLARH